VYTVPETGKLEVRNSGSVLTRIDHAHLEVFPIRCRLLSIRRIRRGYGGSRIEVNIVVIIIPVEQIERAVQSVGGLPAKRQQGSNDTQHRFLAEVGGRVTVG